MHNEEKEPKSKSKFQRKKVKFDEKGSENNDLDSLLSTLKRPITSRKRKMAHIRTQVFSPVGKTPKFDKLNVESFSVKPEIC